MSCKLTPKVRVCFAESEWHLGQTLFSHGLISIKQMRGILLTFDLDAGYINKLGFLCLLQKHQKLSVYTTQTNIMKRNYKLQSLMSSNEIFQRVLQRISMR
jgi:hypothetical protein